jgi:hypothetical protein
MSAATFDGVVVKSKIEFVQALRGVAALAVVLWHASRYLGPYGTGIGAKLFLPGQMGVDLFFIISGFIMTVTTQSNDGSTKSSLEFFAKRFAKIWPFYAIATILFLIVARTDLRFLFDFEQFQRLLKGLLFLPSGSATELAPSFAWPPLPIGWTLNYEIYFYLFFGTLMLFGKLRWFAFTTWIVLTLCIVPFYIYAPATLAAALSPMARPP